MLLVLALAAAFGATPATTSIDALCAARSDRALKRAAVRVARIVGDPMTTSSTWRVFDAVLGDRIAHDPDIYSEVADVWTDGGSIAIVNVESRSIDFREDASYCFRSTGTLARIATTSSGTFNIDDETRYFDATGGLVGTSSQLALLHPVPGATVSPDVKPSKPTVFRTAQSLPFFALLDAR